MNVIVSIGRNVGDTPMSDKDWLNYVVAVGNEVSRFRSPDTDLCYTTGESDYSTGEGYAHEESCSWAFETSESPGVLKAVLEDARKRKSTGQWGIAVTFGTTVIV